MRGVAGNLRAALGVSADESELCDFVPDAEMRGEKDCCMRCGSDEWKDIDYSGCSDCREPADGEETT